MRYLRSIKTRFGLIGELITFLWNQKLWWLIPMVMVLVVFGLFLVVAQGTAIIHFVYPLF